MNKWQQGVVIVVLLAEIVVTAQPAFRAGGEPTHLGPWPGILLASATILLVTAGAAVVTVCLRPRSRTWLATFTATHAAAAALGWSHGMPLLTLVAVAAALLVPAVVMVPEKPSQ